MKKKLFLFVVFFFAGCGWKREMVRVRDEIDEIHYRTHQIDSLQRRQYEVLFEMRAEILQRLDDLNTRIQTLENRLRDLEQRVEMGTIRGLNVAGAEQTKAETTASYETETSPLQTEILYTQATKDYVMGQYNLAIQGFTEFLRRFPSSDLSDNARYWIGECYLALGDKDKAKKEFERVVKDYPDGNKRPTALYKLGVIAQMEGNIEKARGYFKLITKQYPETEEAQKTKIKLKELK